MIDYAQANIRFRSQKSALTRAKKQGPEAVLQACTKAVQEWDRAPFNGAWPDDWSAWQRALNDAYPYHRAPRLDDLR